MNIKKRNFIDYPNPIDHMILWGLGSGTILGTLFTFWIFSQAPNAATDILSRLFLLLASFWTGLIFGGISGIILGFLSGLTLSRIMRNVLAPFTWEDMQAYRVKVYTDVGLVTTILSSIPIILILSLIFWAASVGEEIGLIPYNAGFLVPFIAGVAAIYAAHRYMFRLRLWSEAISQKEKAKNFGHLEDEVEEMDFDEESEAKKAKR